MNHSWAKWVTKRRSALVDKNTNTSVEELQARITELSVDTDGLKQSENVESAAQHRLNAILDPVARLPLELSSEIFFHCIPPRPKPGSRAAPMLLLNVCSAWSDIALSTPMLWATIHLDFPGTKILSVWLERARHCALSISLRKSLDDGVAAVLRQYAKQLKHFESYEQKPNVNSLTSLPCLETLTFGSPLEATSFSSLDYVSLEYILGLLRLTPKLEKCTFLSIFIKVDLGDHKKQTFPNLRVLEFGVAGLENPGGGDNILHHITLPALETLAVRLRDLSDSHFSLFLKRSSPPLRKLVLSGGVKGLQFIRLGEWLRLLPSLVDLEFYTVQSVFIDDLFSALADSSPQLLPNLQSLKIYHHLPTPFSYQKLLRLLSARTQLVCFHLKGFSGYEPRPHADVRDRLRQLVADGIEIYIGSRTQNYISPM
ncbi:hypothetical protein MVEN_02043300 [Mycena venus]|uniref:F-box domain-containing protein n=1 Tax=Mycena venus TaxID=2733690 RepID=A0A8H7CHT3_9AGAR|nr:hypothetical protein MVEN_02043300 [Mycena venus]